MAAPRDIFNINVNVHVNEKFDGNLSFPIQTFADPTTIATDGKEPIRVAIKNRNFGIDELKQSREKKSKKGNLASNIFKHNSFRCKKFGYFIVKLQHTRKRANFRTQRTVNFGRPVCSFDFKAQ